MMMMNYTINPSTPCLGKSPPVPPRKPKGRRPASSRLQTAATAGANETLRVLVDRAIAGPTRVRGPRVGSPILAAWNGVRVGQWLFAMGWVGQVTEVEETGVIVLAASLFVIVNGASVVRKRKTRNQLFLLRWRRGRVRRGRLGRCDHPIWGHRRHPEHPPDPDRTAALFGRGGERVGPCPAWQHTGRQRAQRRPVGLRTQSPPAQRSRPGTHVLEPDDRPRA